MDIKPIETIYNGYRFRSRLEARWAVFFDAIGQEYEYEPEGFELSDGTMYLPDFYLEGVRGRGTSNIYIEIKGNLDSESLHKIDLFGNRWEMNFETGEEEQKGYPIIVFGKIPSCEWVKPEPKERIKPHWWFEFGNIDYRFYNLQWSEGDNYNTVPKAANGGGLVLDYPDDPYDFVDNALTAKAYIKARQARFEHGEVPA